MSSIVPTINVHTLEQWLKMGDVLLIDVREEHEFKESSIPGATLVPLSLFNSEIILQQPDKKIVFQCRSGQRSERACFIFQQNNPDVKAYNLEGGILAWAVAGFPTNNN